MINPTRAHLRCAPPRHMSTLPDYLFGRRGEYPRTVGLKSYASGAWLMHATRAPKGRVNVWLCRFFVLL
jgi:hypothetical protein